jgi:predicted dehydrogenase
LAKKRGVICMTGFMKRHGLTYKKARELITSGQFTPSVGFFKYSHWKSGGNGDFRRMLHNMSIHIVDLAISFLGEVTVVNSTTFRNKEFGSVLLTLKFRNGCAAQIMLDGSQPRIQEHVEISGQMDGNNALIRIDNVMHMELHQSKGRGIDLGIKEPQECYPQFELSDIQVWRPDYGIPNMAQDRQFAQGFAGEVREFCDAIIEKRESYPGTGDCLKAMRVIDAVCKNLDGVTELGKCGNS